MTVANILATVPNFAVSSRHSHKLWKVRWVASVSSDGAERYINASLSQFVDSKTTFNGH